MDIDTLKPSVSQYELYFLIEVPPLGTRTYFLSKSSSSFSGAYLEESKHYAYAKNFGMLDFF